MGRAGNSKTSAVIVLPLVGLVLAVLLLAGACSEEDPDVTGGGDSGGNPVASSEGGSTTPVTSIRPETTADEPPEITLGREPGGRPEAILRLEGGPGTTFSGLCTVGEQDNVLSGEVPKRFTFDLNGADLSCRIEKRDEGRGALRIVLVAGDTTRSVQQTNDPGATMNITYKGG